MKSNNEKTPQRTRRKNTELEKIIQNEITIQAIEKGFSRISLYSISKGAGILPAIIRNRYKNTEGMLAAYLQNYNYWLNDLIEKHFNEFEEGKHKQFLTNLLKEVVKKLHKDKIMQQLLIWEVQEKNQITQKTAVIREANTYMYNQFYNDHFKHSNIGFKGFMGIMLAGIFYLVLHRKVSDFCGLNLKNKEGMDSLLNTIEALCNCFFEQSETDKKTVEIAQKMKENNINVNIISDCTGLSLEQIENLRL